MIHRDAAGGISRHFVGTGVPRGAPRRNESGAMYLYHGARHAPFWAPSYRWPKGEHHHHFHRHDRFPVVFLIPEYFVDDYGDYDLTPPPPNAQWVRYGDDLVLVDIDTGDILQVIEGVFTDEAGDGAPEDAAGPSDEPAPVSDAAQPPPN